MTDAETRRARVRVDITRPVAADAPDPADHVPFADGRALACSCGWAEGGAKGWLEHLPPEPAREPTGEWAEIWERPTTAEIRDYLGRVRRSEDALDSATEAVRVFTFRWHVTDPATGDLLGLTQADIERAPWDVTEQLQGAIAERLPNR